MKKYIRMTEGKTPDPENPGRYKVHPVGEIVEAPESPGPMFREYTEEAEPQKAAPSRTKNVKKEGDNNGKK